MSEPVDDRPTVVTAIVTSERGVLLCRRIDGSPLWSFPGGEVEDAEAYPDTAERECQEETGLQVVSGEVLGERVHPKSKRHMVYIACAADGDLTTKVGDPEEHSEVRWVPWSEAEGLLPYLFEPVEAHLRAALS